MSVCPNVPRVKHEQMCFCHSIWLKGPPPHPERRLKSQITWGCYGEWLIFRIVQQKIMLVLGVPRRGVGPGGKLRYWGPNGVLAGRPNQYVGHCDSVYLLSFQQKWTCRMPKIGRSECLYIYIYYLHRPLYIILYIEMVYEWKHITYNQTYMKATVTFGYRNVFVPESSCEGFFLKKC